MRRDYDTQASLIFIGIVILFLFLLHSCSSILSATTYNNGIHEGCGGHWVYETAVGHQYTTSYIYHCDKCGITIELNDRYLTK